MLGGRLPNTFASDPQNMLYMLDLQQAITSPKIYRKIGVLYKVLATLWKVSVCAEEFVRG